MAAGCGSNARSIEPSIEFSKIPEARQGGGRQLDEIEGRVIGAKSGQRIVLFAKSGAWWVQPISTQPFTEIGAGSKWTNSTHFGTEYAALLVDASYRPPTTADALPLKGGAVIAVAAVKGRPRPEPVPKTVHFSGYEWDVREVPSDRGGTSNEYAASNAWTDERGWLHLRVARDGNAWTCAEVTLMRSLGYGSYRLVVRDTKHLEPAAVFSMFTWDDLATDLNHRELDIEISRWGDAAGKSVQYAVQPYYVPVNVVRFEPPAGVLTHLLRWEPGRVLFKTTRDANGSTVAEHEFTSGIPSPGGEMIHIDLYVYGKSRVPLQHEAEVVIEKFEYLP
jgi:hypothetical protein